MCKMNTFIVVVVFLEGGAVFICLPISKRKVKCNLVHYAGLIGLLVLSRD